MDGFLTELKQHSSILSNIWSDCEESNSARSPLAPQVPQFFDFSYSISREQSENTFEQELSSSRSLKGTKPKQTKSKISGFESQERSARNYNRDSKENYFDFSVERVLDDVSPKKSANSSLQVLSDFQNRTNQGQFTAVGGHRATQPRYCSSESYSPLNDKSTEDLIFQSLTWSDDDSEARDSWFLESDKENSVGLCNFRQLQKIQLIEDLIELSKDVVDFGPQLPGKVVEESLQIINKSDKSLTVEIIVACLNPELQDTLEYVYSVRNTFSYDYNERHVFTIGPHSLVSFKTVLKAPAAKSGTEVQGQIKVIIPNCQGEQKAILKSSVVIPKVSCPKQLYSTVIKQNIISMAVQTSKKQERKVPLTNDSNVPVTLELDFYTPPGVFSSECCELSISPKILTIPAHGKATVTITIRPVNSVRMSSVDEYVVKKALQRILYAKAQNSSVFYSFLLRIETF